MSRKDKNYSFVGGTCLNVVLPLKIFLKLWGNLKENYFDIQQIVLQVSPGCFGDTNLQGHG